MVNFPKKPLLPLPAASKLSKPGHFVQNVAHKAQTALDQAKQREIERMKETLMRDLEMETNAAVNALKRRKEALNRFKSGAEPKVQDHAAKANFADPMNEFIKEETEIIKMIMESKNAMVEAILKMMQALFATH